MDNELLTTTHIANLQEEIEILQRNMNAMRERNEPFHPYITVEPLPSIQVEPFPTNFTRDIEVKVEEQTITDVNGFTYTCYKCPICHEELFQGDNYCSYCGQRLNWEEKVEMNLQTIRGINNE